MLVVGGLGGAPMLVVKTAGARLGEAASAWLLAGCGESLYESRRKPL